LPIFEGKIHKKTGMKNRFFIQLAFNGKNYNGWQIQKNANSVQATLNDGLTLLLNQSINVVGCGRTDAGVHARKFFAHFDVDGITDTQVLADRLNGYLPKDLVITRIFPVKPGSHARFDATARTYRYYISRKKNPFLQDLTYHFQGNLDVEIMNQGASMLLTINDFSSFSKVKTQVKTNFCKVSSATWETEQDMLVFTITADRFLRNMVRAIVGTLLKLGRHKISLDEFKSIIESKKRARAGDSVPAHGLFLEKVSYPGHIFMNEQSATPLI
jgi:tRNA pseudouridine38-40 synthase